MLLYVVQMLFVEAETLMMMMMMVMMAMSPCLCLYVVQMLADEVRV